MTAAFVVPSSAVAAPHTGGLDLTATPEQPAETAPPAVGAVEIPAGMRTTNGVRAKRYKGKNADGRTAYFARVPLKAPVEVQRAVIAANKIVGKPYKWGGGHAKVEDSGYDCSGTVSYSLIGAGLLKTPLSSYEFDDVWKVAERGKGQWISVYGNRSHVYAVIAGLRLDTSAAGDRSGSRRLKGPQWRPDNRTDAKRFTLVHPTGL
ncbi:MAG: C40 family peptidase [Solirubrobacteraceae bacterium]|nr:C40 family peptidase [Solirubrobacteraceae bacterium]